MSILWIGGALPVSATIATGSSQAGGAPAVAGVARLTAQGGAAASEAARHEVPDVAGLRARLLGGSQEVRDAAALLLGMQDLVPADEQLALVRAAENGWARRAAPAERALLLGVACRAHYRRNDMPAARAACDEALRVARDSGDAGTLSHALRLSGFLRTKTGDPVAAFPLLRQALDIARSIPDDTLEAAALNSLGVAAENLGVYREASEYYAGALAAAQRADNRGLEAMVTLNTGLLQILTGEPATAIETAQRARHLALESGGRQTAVLAAAAIADAYVVIGERPAARAMLRDQQRAFDDDSLDSSVRSPLLAAAGRVSLADAQLEEAAQFAARASEAAASYPFWQVGAGVLLIDVHRAAGRRAQALREIDRQLPKAQMYPVLHADLLQRKAALVAEGGDWRGAYGLLREQAQLVGNAARGRTLQQVAFLRNAREAELRDRELETLRATKAEAEVRAARDRVQRNVALAIATLAVIVLVLLGIVWSQRNEARVRRQLEEAVNRRTLELSEQMERRRSLERQLEHRQRLEAVGRLTGGVAHDFNNLMTIVQQAAELLRLRPTVTADGGALQLVNECMQAARSGGAISRQLVSFARQQPLQPTLLELRTFLDSVRGLLERAAGDGREFTIEPPVAGLRVHVDSGQLTAALINLVTNARDFTDQGGHIVVAARAVTVPTAELATGPLRAGRYVAIEVSDDGRGMDAETVRRAVEPFYSTKEVGAGAGLGLSMVHGFATQSGGDVAIDSAPGMGARIVLLLPEVLASP
ncbi:MAG: ATP-binding protein [Steroidobacteraceae bacterium]